MNSLFSGSWRREADGGGGEVQMNRNPSSSAAGGVNLDKFFEDVKAIKDELKEVERIHRRLDESNEASKTLHAASAVRDYREAVEWCYYTVTGEKPDKETVEALVATGEGERFLQRAIEEQGRGRVLDVRYKASSVGDASN